ncbi:hypothetical protein, partial [Akkermansia sp.]|uniref:hypothetical protein n=1 Tax=Akkermansia sp. TaxID=1872421 RepID=UPI003AB56D48
KAALFFIDLWYPVDKVRFRTPPLFAYGKIDIFPYSLPRFAHHEIAFVHHCRKNRKANEK